MARGVKAPVEERIKKQQEIVEKAKAKLQLEESKLKSLQDELAKVKEKELMTAIESSDKSIEEIMKFLNS